jgi:hypothetical protein
MSDRDLEAALLAVGRDLAFPEVPDLAPAVLRRLEEGERAPQRRLVALPSLFRRPGRRVALALAAVLLLGGGAVAGGLLVQGVRILVEPEATAPPPSPRPSVPLGSFLFLGERTTLAEARRQTDFEVLIPRATGLPDPEVYVDDDPPGGRVSLVYPEGPGLPETEELGVGMLVMEFRARIDRPFLEKVVHEAKLLQEVEVGDAPGYWVEGEHTVFYLDEEGQPVEERSRLAGNTLLWQRGEVTLRLESALSMEDAIRLAESFE